MVNILFPTQVSPNRPFRHARPDLFDSGKWVNFFKSIWTEIKSGYEKKQQFQQSHLGRITTYAAYELVGSYAGSKAGELILGKVFSAVGKPFIYASLINGAVASSIGTMAFKTSKVGISCFIVAIASTAILMYFPADHLFTIGSSSGLLLGETIGNLAGTILGGYIGLKFANAPLKLVDQNNPWDSYSVSMLRFQATGMGFDLFIASSIPFVGPLYTVPRGIIKSLSQTLAYSSNSLLPLAKECLRTDRLSKKVLTPFLVQLITSRFSRSQGTMQPISKTMTKKIFSALSFLPSIVEKSLHVGIESGLELVVSSNNANALVSTVLKSFHRFLILLRTSNEVKNAEISYERSFFGSLAARQSSEKQLLEELGKLTNHNGNLKSQLLVTALESFLKGDKIQGLTDSLISKIQDLEVETVGFKLLGNNQSSYLKSVVNIYIKHYLIFVLLNWQEFNKELTPIEEQDIILDISHGVIASYINYATPEIIAAVINWATDKTFRAAFKTKDLLSKILVQPDHSAHVSNSEDNHLFESHFGAPSKEDLFKDYVFCNVGLPTVDIAVPAEVQVTRFAATMEANLKMDYDPFTAKK